jgi:hypothetical protein
VPVRIDPETWKIECEKKISCKHPSLVLQLISHIASQTSFISSTSRFVSALLQSFLIYFILLAVLYLFFLCYAALTEKELRQ